jgi:hypothetical protein
MAYCSGSMLINSSNSQLGNFRVFSMANASECNFAVSPLWKQNTQSSGGKAMLSLSVDKENTVTAPFSFSEPSKAEIAAQAAASLFSAALTVASGGGATPGCITNLVAGGTKIFQILPIWENNEIKDNIGYCILAGTDAANAFFAFKDGFLSSTTDKSCLQKIDCTIGKPMSSAHDVTGAVQSFAENLTEVSKTENTKKRKKTSRV